MVDLIPDLTPPSNPSFTASQKSVEEAVKRFSEAHHALSSAISFVVQAQKEADGKSDVVLSDIMPAVSVLEYKWSDALTLLGIPSVIHRDIEERSRSLRAANQKVRDLTRKLGESVSPEAIQSGVKLAHGIVDKWWKTIGLSYVSLFKVGTYRCEIQLSMLSPETRSIEAREGVSYRDVDAIWADEMRQRGFVMMHEEGERDRHIVDCDTNTELFTALIKQRFPNASITGRESYPMPKSDKMRLSKISLSLPLSDIMTKEAMEGDIEE